MPELPEVELLCRRDSELVEGESLRANPEPKVKDLSSIEFASTQ